MATAVLEAAAVVVVGSNAVVVVAAAAVAASQLDREAAADLVGVADDTAAVERPDRAAEEPEAAPFGRAQAWPECCRS